MMNSLIGSISDITEGKLAEVALVETKMLLDSIIEHSPDAMWVADEHGTLIRLNQANRENLHLKDNEVIGKYNIFEDNIVVEQGFMPMVRDVFEKGTTARFAIQYDTSAVKNLNVEKTTTVFLEVHISPIVTSHGKVTNAIRMPELDGYTATRQIRTLNKDVIIIAQTAFAMMGDRQKAIEAGCNDYISKPIDGKSMLELIRKHLKA